MSGFTENLRAAESALMAALEAGECDNEVGEDLLQMVDRAHDLAGDARERAGDW